jgi:hypothetical protein
MAGPATAAAPAGRTASSQHRQAQAQATAVLRHIHTRARCAPTAHPKASRPTTCSQRASPSLASGVAALLAALCRTIARQMATSSSASHAASTSTPSKTCGVTSSKRKHLKGSDQVKRLRTDFIAERLQGDGITSTEEAQRMFDEDEPRAMTEGERKTWTEYNIQLAWLQKLA